MQEGNDAKSVIVVRTRPQLQLVLMLLKYHFPTLRFIGLAKRNYLGLKSVQKLLMKTDAKSVVAVRNIHDCS